MKINEVTGPEIGGNVQYQPVADKGPKTPEELAAINAQRAASGQQAADVAANQARLASGLYTPAGFTRDSSGQLVIGSAEPVTAPTAPTSPAAPTAPVATPTASGQSYTVKSGDNLTKIAKQMGTTLPELLNANPQYKANPNLIRPGEKINPPGSAVKPGMPVTPAQPASAKIVTPVAPTPAAPVAPKAAAPVARDNFAQANAYMDQQDAAAKQKWIDNRARAGAARQKSNNANTVVDNELAAMDKQTAAIKAGGAPSSKYYVQPAKVGMNGEMDYVVVDRPRGLEVKSFNSQAEADAWIKTQPVRESLDRILTIAGLK